MIRAFAAFLVYFCSAVVFGQVPFPQLPQPVTTFAFEDKDWRVEATATPKKGPQYHAPTPTSIPGARVIKTLELKALLESNKNVVVVDVLDSKTRTSVPGAYWMSGGGDGPFFFVSVPNVGCLTTHRCTLSKQDIRMSFGIVVVATHGRAQAWIARSRPLLVGSGAP
jgi:hypothetical protein